MRHRTALLGVVAVACLLAGEPLMSAPTAARPRTDHCRPHWVAAWASVPTGTTATGRELTNQSARLTLAPSSSGRKARIRLSNRFGAAPVRLDSIFLGRQGVGAAVVPGTNRRVRFDGRKSVTIPPGRDVLSDPVRIRVKAFRAMSVSMHVKGSVAAPNEHHLSARASYLSAPGSGDHAREASGHRYPTKIYHGLFLSGLDVWAPPGRGAVVAFGDSITEGWTGYDNIDSYPDVMAQRLARRQPGRFSVVNTGVGGNRVLGDSMPSWSAGDAALTRFRPDVLRLAGVTDVIVMEGSNDLALGETATELISGLRIIMRGLQEKGLRVIMGTVPPRPFGEQPQMQRRREVNAWIRKHARFVADFDKALRDPHHPGRMNPALDVGDGVHPSAAGYRAMAKAVPTGMLRGSDCD